MPQSKRTFRPITDRQREIIRELAGHLGLKIVASYDDKADDEIVMPRSSGVAYRLIHKLSIMAREANGGHDHPTSTQINTLADLAVENGRKAPYKEPKTRKQASALIKRLIDDRIAADADREAVAA